MLKPIDICLALANEFMRPHAPIRQRLRAYRHARSVALGANMRVHFEDAITLAYQVLEILRSEAIARPTRELIVDEIAHYAAIYPQRGALSATLFLAPSTDAADPCLARLNDAVHCVHLKGFGDARVSASVNADVANRHRDRLSGVHFLCFEETSAVQARGELTAVACDHVHYRAHATLPSSVREVAIESLIAYGASAFSTASDNR
jgi:hypothetical protein